MEYTGNIHINIIYQISSSQALHTFQHPYIQKKQQKLIHEFILYKRNFL